MTARRDEGVPYAADRFIPYYLLSGPRLTEWKDEAADKNQLRYEKHLRSIVAEHGLPAPCSGIRLGEPSELDMPWELHQAAGGFINLPMFSRTPHRVEFLAAAVLETDEKLTVPVYMWTYAAVELWLNGVLAASEAEPVYKPIRRLEAQLELKPGSNLLILRVQNLAIRDTRNIIGVELGAHTDKIRFNLPDAGGTRPLLELDRWLGDLSLYKGRLRLPPAPPCTIRLAYEEDGLAEEAEDITGAGTVELRPEKTMVVVSGEIEGTRRFRRIELLHHKRPAKAVSSGDDDGIGGYAHTRRMYAELLFALIWREGIIPAAVSSGPADREKRLPQ